MSALEVLAAFMALDLLFGDPVCSLHPIRLYGRLIALLEKVLRRLGLDGRFGGFLLTVLLLLCAEGVVMGVRWLMLRGGFRTCADIWFVFIGYTHIAVRDLLAHGRRVRLAMSGGDLSDARGSVSMMVGRDVDRLDLDGCGRAAVESLAENLTDGVLAPLFFYALLGVPGMVFFKVVSTLDSMVGHKNAKYAEFGWFAAKSDDVLNYVPARLSAPIIALSALFTPKCSSIDALRTAWAYHGRTSSPNSGWSEAAVAGALGRRLGGPCWYGGEPAASEWIGDDSLPSSVSAGDVSRTLALVALSSAQAAVLAGCLTFLSCSW